MKIGQLSEHTGLSTHTLRYYEKMGLIDAARKDASGHRSYGSSDVELVNWVNCLKKSGMTLENIKIYGSAFKRGDRQQLATMLRLHVQKLEQQQQDINHYLDVTQRKLKNLQDA